MRRRAAAVSYRANGYVCVYVTCGGSNFSFYEGVLEVEQRPEAAESASPLPPRSGHTRDDFPDVLAARAGGGPRAQRAAQVAGPGAFTPHMAHTQKLRGGRAGRSMGRSRVTRRSVPFVSGDRARRIREAVSLEKFHYLLSDGQTGRYMVASCVGNHCRVREAANEGTGALWQHERIL